MKNLEKVYFKYLEVYEAELAAKANKSTGKAIASYFGFGKKDKDGNIARSDSL